MPQLAEALIVVTPHALGHLQCNLVFIEHLSCPLSVKLHVEANARVVERWLRVAQLYIPRNWDLL